MLILDLDDTIFQTSSMNSELFESAISIVRKFVISSDPNTSLGELNKALWSRPIDTVFSKFNVTEKVADEFYNEIVNIDFSKLDIHPFEDYYVIQSLSMKKILVTTGLRELQQAKIKALGIMADFDSIRIDDPRVKPRQHKIDLFGKILVEGDMSPQQIWVIGDNPESEIKAGKQLGMKTILRKTSTEDSSKYADFEIESFKELKNIIKP